MKNFPVYKELKVHAQLSSWARSSIFILCYLHPFFVYAGYESSRQTAHLHRTTETHIQNVPNSHKLANSYFMYSKSHSKIDKTKILMTTGSLMKVESIAECSPFGAFCNTYDLH